MTALRKYRVTEWGHPEDRIETQWGTIYYHRWLQKEAERWRNKWREAWTEANSEGLVAMYTFAEYQKEIK
jgi:hypothetical protein